MTKCARTCVLSVVCILFFSASSSSFEGPLRVGNQFPLFLHLNPASLESASTENSFSAGMSYSSVFMVKRSEEWGVGLDMELAEMRFRYRRDIPGLFEVGVEVPFLSFGSGFMDDFLERYHETFGFPDYGRSHRPDNDFLYEVRENGVMIVKAEHGGVGLGDVKLTVKRSMRNTDPQVSVMGEVDLPTGSASRGYGSGSLDAGFRVLLDKKLGEKIILYSNAGIVFPGKLRASETIGLRTFVHGGVGIEAKLWKTFSLLGQILIQSSPFPETDIEEIDDFASILSLGGRYSSGAHSLELSLTEDPNTTGAPDFTLNLSYRRRF